MGRRPQGHRRAGTLHGRHRQSHGRAKGEGQRQLRRQQRLPGPAGALQDRLPDDDRSIRPRPDGAVEQEHRQRHQHHGQQSSDQRPQQPLPCQFRVVQLFHSPSTSLIFFTYRRET